MEIGKAYFGTNVVFGLGGPVGPAPFSGLLDEYPGAYGAFSLRQLSSTYTGSAVMVRRASDNAEQAIGFVNNELDVTTLESFCAGTDGFVTTWYNQTGNGVDAFMTQSVKQPQIVSGSNVIEVNSKPAIFWGSGDVMATSDYILEFSANSVSAFVVKGISTTNGQFVLSEADNLALSSNVVIGALDGNNILWVNGTTIGTMPSGQVLVGVDKVVGANPYITYANGTFSASGSATTNAEVGNRTMIGGRVDYEGLFIGYQQEIITYKFDNSSNRAGIESNINTYYSIY
jgi:hypothetical protein